MIADTLHTLSDGISDVVTLWAIYMASLPHSTVFASHTFESFSR